MISRAELHDICDQLTCTFLGKAKIGSGGHSDIYRIETDDGEIVLKVRHSDSGSDLNDEFDTMQYIGSMGPQPLLYDESKVCLVMELIRGEHPSTVNRDFAKTMATWYSNLHQITSSKQEHHRDH